MTESNQKKAWIVTAANLMTVLDGKKLDQVSRQSFVFKIQLSFELRTAAAVFRTSFKQQNTQRTHVMSTEVLNQVVNGT